MNTRAGQIAKQQLKQELHGKPITLETVGKSYGRNVAIVRVAGRNVNNAMKRRGY